MEKLPKVGIIIIHGHANEEWFKHAIDSCKSQIYPDFEICVINNLDRKKSIGQCWNEAVRKLRDCKYVYFVGDDDYISPDLLISSVATLEMARMSDEQYVQCSSYITGIDENGDLLGYYQKVPTGLWLREYLLKYPFDENLKKQVDTKAIFNIERNGYKRLIMLHHFGYFYRRHKNQVTGEKIPEADVFEKWKRKVYADNVMSYFRRGLIKYHGFVEVRFGDIHKYDGILVFGIYTERTMEAIYKSINKINLHWCGSDLIAYQKEWHKKYDLSKKDNIKHFCGNYEQKEILKSLGIKNVELMPVYAGDISQFEIMDLPEKPGILYYTPGRFKVYGVDRLWEIAQQLPNITFYLVGDKGYLNKLLPNMVNLGHVKSQKIRKIMKHINIYLRLTTHDGFPNLIVESLLCGRYVIFNHKIGLKNISYVHSNEEAIKEIKRLLKYTRPNITGREEVLQVINQFDKMEV